MKKIFLLLMVALTFFSWNASAQWMPQLSDNTEVGTGTENWYYIYYQSFGRAIEYKANDEVVVVETPVDAKDEQLWKVVEVTTNEYRIINKASGAQLYKGDGNYIASTTLSHTYNIFAGSNEVYYPLPLLIENKTISGQYLNVINHNGSGTLHQLSQWGSSSDAGNALQFFTYDQIVNPPVKPADPLPVGLTLSDEYNTVWYYIKSTRAGLDKALQTGADATAQTGFKTITKNDDTQLWKIITSGEAYQFVSKDNNKYLVYDAGKMYATETLPNDNKPYVVETHTASATSYQARIQGTSAEYFDCAHTSFLLGTWSSSSAKNSGGAELLFLTIEEQFLPMPNLDEWYFIQFQNGGTILQDMGEGKPLGASFPTADNDAQLWKVTGTDDNYILESKSGRKISYLDDHFSGATTSDLTFKFIESTSTVYTGTWELQGNNLGEDKALGQKSVSLYSAIINNDLEASNNCIKFIDPNNMDYANYPSAPELDTWYYLYFKAGDMIVQYEGDEKKVITSFPNQTSNDAQLWKIVETTTPGEFNIVSKSSGAKIWYDQEEYASAGRLVASLLSATPIKIVPTTHSELKPAWELEMASLASNYRYMNINGGMNIYNELGTWTNSNQPNNVINFTLYNDINFASIPAMPNISNEESTYWHQIKYKNEGNVIQDMGADQNLKTRSFDGGLDQLWKVTGVQKEYKIASVGGASIHKPAAGYDIMYQASITNSTNISIQVHTGNTYKPGLGLYTDTSGNYGQLNQKSNTADQEIRQVQGTTNDNSALEFIVVSSVPALPEFNAGYYIQFSSGNVLEDTGSGLSFTAIKDGAEGQLWKVIGNAADFTLISGKGNKITFDITSGFGIGTTSDATFALMFDPSNSASGWELKYKFNQSDFDANVDYVLNETNNAAAPHTGGNFFSLVPFTSTSTTWTGNADTTWDNIQNWSMTVPDATTEVIIPETATTTAPEIASNTTIASLTMANGTQVKLTNNVELTVSGTVAFESEVENYKWYSIGFPFNATANYMPYATQYAPGDELLIPYEEGTGGDFWLKDYNGSTGEFAYATSINAGTGYIAQFPRAFNNEVITYQSGVGSHTFAKKTAADLSITSDYKFIANPSLEEIDLPQTDGTHYYIFNGTGLFERLTSGTLKPFEAIIAVSNPAVLRSFIDAGDGYTGIDPKNSESLGEIKNVRYFNLQGIEIAEPKEAGVFIKKTTFESGKEITTKFINNKK